MASANVDARSPRFGQGLTGLLSLVAFLADVALLVPLLAAVLLAGAIFGPGANLWSLLYAKAVKPALKLAPPRKLKDPAPTRFANAIGGVFLGAATALLFLAPDLAVAGIGLGWILVLVVAALALLAAATDICVGCEIYVLIQRFRSPKPAEA
jgi:hypothetical protein